MELIVIALGIWLAFSFLEPAAMLLGGILKFLKNNWYLFIIVLWFFRS